MNRKITEVVPCHHEGHPSDTWKTIDMQSRKVGSMAGPYHYWIDRGGKVETGRPLDWPSGHATSPRQANRCISVGINVPKGMAWTEPQKRAFDELIVRIMKEDPKRTISEVHGLPMQTKED